MRLLVDFLCRFGWGLAAALAVVPGTATTMVKGLAAAGLVSHRPRYGVQLTAGGRRVALGVLRRHRLKIGRAHV